MINSFIPATELEQPIRAHLWCYPLFICGWISLTLFFIIQSICRIVSIFVGWQCLKPTTILVLHSRVSHGRLLPPTKVALWNSDRELNTLKSQNSSRCGNSRVVYHAQKYLFWQLLNGIEKRCGQTGTSVLLKSFTCAVGVLLSPKNDFRGMLK